jgi:hypothetical protein
VLGQPIWDAARWSRSAEVQQRLAGAVTDAAGGRTIRCRETVRVSGCRLVTVDAPVAPLIRDGVAVALIASALDVSTGLERIGPERTPARR